MLPREKLLKEGVVALNTSELLAIVLNTGYKGEHVVDLAARLIKDYGAEALASASAPIKIMQRFKVPIVKACQIAALFEIGRRTFAYMTLNPPCLRRPRDVFKHLTFLRTAKKEEFVGLYLNVRNRLIYQEVLAVGSLELSVVHPREVFAPAMEYRASRVIVCHNHPSGDPTPSSDDITLTRKLIEASKLLGIPILDHIIIAADSYVSLQEKGII